MIGRSLIASFIPGMFVGVMYLATIMWWVSGYTPLDVIDAMTDIINQPLWQIAEVLR